VACLRKTYSVWYLANRLLLVFVQSKYRWNNCAHLCQLLFITTSKRQHLAQVSLRQIRVCVQSSVQWSLVLIECYRFGHTGRSELVCVRALCAHLLSIISRPVVWHDLSTNDRHGCIVSSAPQSTRSTNLSISFTFVPSMSDNVDDESTTCMRRCLSAYTRARTPISTAPRSTPTIIYLFK
jgi:hypothetical protein